MSMSGETPVDPFRTYPAQPHLDPADATHPASTPDPAAPAAAPGPGRRRKRPGWVGVGAAALAAATAASLGTAALVGAFDSGPTPGSALYESLGAQQVTVPVSGSTADNPDWQLVTAAVRESVVAITVQTPRGSGEGSGVIIGKEGIVLTNEHVVSGGQNGTITVSLADGRLYEARIVGADATTDIAVLRLVDPPSDLAVATLGDSDDVVVGAAVLAVGNPLGLDATATTGIVSAVDRPVTTQESGTGSAVVTNAIQVDAAINPGNSGGPLFDSAGEVIGITSSIATMSSAAGSAGSIGLGFAIGINQAMLIADQILANGTAEHAFLGVTLSDGTATAAGTTRRGAVVQQVTAATPAEQAGLRTGDVVVGMDGRAISGAESLTGFVRQHAGGDEVVLTVVRDGEAFDLAVTLATRPVE